MTSKRSVGSRRSFLGPVARALVKPSSYLRAVREPAWAFRGVWVQYRLARANRSQVDFITALVPGVEETRVRATLAELRANRSLFDHIEERMGAVMELTQGRLPGWMPLGQGEALYALIRLARPSIVVETGVGHGMSSTFFLQGLEDNGEGVLHSIDVPLTMRVADHPPGCIVPDHLRHRWNLILGDSKSELPRLLDELGAIDLFVHDSEHTPENMRFEYQQAWAHLGEGGLLLSDDVGAAFVQFCDSVHRPLIRFDRMGGITHP